jgi:hypothetical protein
MLSAQKWASACAAPGITASATKAAETVFFIVLTLEPAATPSSAIGAGRLAFVNGKIAVNASKDCLVLRNSEGIARANADGERFQAEGSREFRLEANLEDPIPPTDEALAEACRAIGAEMDAIEIWNQEAAGRSRP